MSETPGIYHDGEYRDQALEQAIESSNQTVSHADDENIQRILKQLFLQTSQKIWKLLKDADITIFEDNETGEKMLAIDTENPELKGAIRKALEQRENIIEIGKYLAKLPEKSLMAIAHTDALKWEWHRRRNRNYWVANFFIANSLLLDSKALVKGAAKELGKWGYEIAHAYADLLRKEWELIDAAHPHLQKFLPKLSIKYPFKSSRDLFLEIQIDNEKTRFANYSNNDSYPIYAKTWTEEWKLIALRDSNSHPVQKNLTILNLTKYPHQWLDVVLLFSPLIAEGKRTLRLERKLANYYSEIEAYAQVLSEAGEARTASGKVAKSMIWLNGNLHINGRRVTFSQEM
jgi:hypothetical protein